MEELIRAASRHFEQLLREQLARQERMAQGAASKDFAKADHIVIGIVDGDGIGPIIMREARRAAEKLLAEEIASGRVEQATQAVSRSSSSRLREKPGLPCSSLPPSAVPLCLARQPCFAGRNGLPDSFDKEKGLFYSINEPAVPLRRGLR